MARAAAVGSLLPHHIPAPCSTTTTICCALASVSSSVSIPAQIIIPFSKKPRNKIIVSLSSETLYRTMLLVPKSSLLLSDSSSSSSSSPYVAYSGSALHLSAGFTQLCGMRNLLSGRQAHGAIGLKGKTTVVAVAAGDSVVTGPRSKRRAAKEFTPDEELVGLRKPFESVTPGQNLDAYLVPSEDGHQIGSVAEFEDGPFETSQLHSPASTSFHAEANCLFIVNCEEVKLLQSSSSSSLHSTQRQATVDIVALHSSSTEAEIFPGDRARDFVERSSSLSHLLRDPKWQAVVQFAVVGAIMGMQACAPALAEVVGPEVASEQSAGIFSNLGDIQSGFASAFLLIFFSEIGDKTFFIAALLATRKSNLAVFTGTFGALAAMTVISVTLGRAFHYLDGVLPFSLGNMELPLDDLAAVVLLVYFGVSTLLEASSMDGSKAEEEQQEAELAIAGVGADGAQGLQATAGTVAAAFALVFVAEWGDKSFFSTIALAAASSPLGVVTGAIAGHGVATALAVLGGSFLGTYISEKVIAYVGGALFLVFAAATLVEIVR